MTATELRKLTDEEIDRIVAEKVMGWVYREDENENGLICRWNDARGKLTRFDWHPSTDRNDTALVLAEIERRVLGCILVTFLPVQVDCVNLHRDRLNLYSWALLNATPRQVCEAAILAVEGMK